MDLRWVQCGSGVGPGADLFSDVLGGRWWVQGVWIIRQVQGEPGVVTWVGPELSSMGGPGTGESRTLTQGLRNWSPEPRDQNDLHH